ncbi:MAG: ABC transporter permease subunit [Clostridiaceae bacterium]|nr:ABC transporter permease subunit [Clostridiaceae bacterium]
MSHNGRGGKRLTLLTICLLIAIVCVNLIFPMLNLLAKAIDFTPFYKGFADAFRSGSVRRALFNSLAVSLVSSFIAVSMAFFYAYIVEIKLSGKARRFFRFFSVLPMLVPSITHGIVIIYLFGKMGIATRIMGFQLPIYGPLGIILGSFFYAFPIAFLVMSQAFSNLDGRLYENAAILGVQPFRRLWQIVFPITKYALFSAFAICFTMIFADYGIPLSVGGTFPILPILFYKNVVGMLDFQKGAIYSALILLPAAVVYLLDTLVFSKKQVNSRHNKIRVRSGPFAPAQKLAFGLITAALATPVLLIIATPFIKAWPYDMTPTLSHFARIFETGKLMRLISNSIFIAFMTGLLGMCVAFTAGYVYIRDHNELKPLKKLTHGLYMASLAVPGLALGLAFALFYRGSFIYNTFAILIFVNISHFFGSPYMMVISHLKLLNPNLENTCRSLGGSAFRVFWDVIIPNSRKMLTDVFIYFFTNTMITISAVSLLYNLKTMTLALQITAYNDQGDWESAIAVSLVIFSVNVTLKLIQTMRSRSKATHMQEPLSTMPENTVLGQK